MFAPSVRSIEAVVAADASDGFLAVGEAAVAFQPPGAPGGEPLFDGDDAGFVVGGQFAWAVMGGAAVVGEAVEGAVETAQPLADGVGGGVEVAGGGLHAVLSGMADHFQPQVSGVFTVTHGGVV